MLLSRSRFTLLSTAAQVPQQHHHQHLSGSVFMRLLTTKRITASATALFSSAFTRHQPAAVAFTTTALSTTCFRPASVAAYSSASSTTTMTQAEGTCASPADQNGGNPLLDDWSNQPYNLPPFHLIQPSHFESALEVGMEQHSEDLKAIANASDEPTFENVIEAYDRAGKLYKKVAAVYGNMCSSLNTPDLQPIQSKMAPILSKHKSKCYLEIPGLFDRIKIIYDKRSELNLTPEQNRLVERLHLDYTRAGAALSEEKQKELTQLNAELATLQTQFQQNVMKDEEEYELVLSEQDMVGCPDFLKAAAKNAAKESSKAADDEYVITLSRSLVEPFLKFADRRDLRKQAFEAWIQRGEMDLENRDNLKLAVQILQIRKRVAEIHGYDTFAHYQCADRMAQTPSKVMELLENVWNRAKESANKEREDMESYIRDTGEELEGGIQAWDWRYYAEKVRKAKYDLDEALLKPYLSLDNVREAMFAVSNSLFGLKYNKLNDVEAYHPDVDVYEVTDENTKGKVQSIFLHDNFARPYKQSGAWMSEFREQHKNLDPSAPKIEGVPVVSNNNNFAKSETTLLSYDDAKTMFHEFGHGHHGMLSDATYSRLASTNVLTDFVELPSQLMEHWFDEREVIKKYALHYETGEPIPDELLDKLEAAKSFQQGFQTVEYSACALLDMALHQVDDYTNFDIAEFEKRELERLGMPQGIVMRHRPAHFQHLFSTSMYAAGYYVYLWADVLVADAYAAFEEAGNCFDKETAARLQKYIYSAGNTQAPDELFRQFRGRDPEISYLLKERGLV